MATSGTVGATVIDTATLLEHAFRRATIPASKQTPEKVTMATQNLYLILLALSNRGLNLWCVEKTLIPLVVGQAVYSMPTGTLDLVNVVHSRPSQILTTNAYAGNAATGTVSTATSAVRLGVKYSTIAATDTLTVEYSSDGISYTQVTTYTPGNLATGIYYWFDITPSVPALAWRVRTATTSVADDLYVAGAVFDLPVQIWNKDTYAALNNKMQPGSPVTNFMLDKLLTPQITVWPVPNVDYAHLTIWRYRQVQDIGTLTQQIDVPQRWVEAITWQLAQNIAFESDPADMADPNRIATLIQMAESKTLEVEEDETDGAPITIAPRISGYTR